MSLQRKSIRLRPDERPLLVDAYLRRRIPVDQYETRPGDLAALTAEWNSISGRTDAAADLLHYMRSQRKRGLWVKLDGNHQIRPELPDMSAEETELLVAIFETDVAAMSHGSDVLGYDPEIAELIAKEFAAQAGRIIPAHQLIAKLTALRKRGALPKAAEHKPGEEHGFDDIDQAAE